MDIAQELRERSLTAEQEGEPLALLDDAADEIERLRNERNHWMAAARAFDEHLATMRVMFMEHPTIRFR
jgi:hypothetical protein